MKCKADRHTYHRPCVILAEGLLAGSVPEVIRSIGRHNVPVYVHTLANDDIFARIYAKSRFCRAAYTISLDTEAQGVCTVLRQWVQKQNFPQKPMLLPLTDMVCPYVADYRAALAEEFDVCLAPNEIFFRFLDKPQANALAEQCGLTIPQTHSASSKEELNALLEQMPLPTIVKPTWWRQRGNNVDFKTVCCNSKDELLDVSARLIEDGAAIMVQQYIPGDDETVEIYMFYRSLDGAVIHGCTGTKIRQRPPGAGIMASGQAKWSPDLAHLCNEFLDKTDYRGLGGIEFKRYQGRRYFIEMNPRAESCYALAAKVGVDLPWLAYADMTYGGIPAQELPHRQAYYLSGLAYAFLWLEHRRSLRPVRELLRLILSGKTKFDLWTWSDPMPFVAFVAFAVKKVFIKACRRLLPLKQKPSPATTPPC